MQTTSHIRKPAVSGVFYPAEADALRERVRHMLEKMEKPVGAGLPKALIVPHAGYAYSGKVAAAAFALLTHWSCSIKRVVLLGPSHHFTFHGFAVPSVSAFATPLGEVPLADDLPDTFENNSRVTTSDTIHAPEHCLEVELPFLQLTLPSFKLVPVLTGDASANETASLIDQLWGNPDTLIIISTDLSHFQDGNTARRLDASTCHAVESLDHQGLSPRDACGFVALRGLLLAARNHGLGVRTLALANSGDTTGDHYRVVGYGSWALYEGRSIASSSDRVH